jgi:pimeloyl-ACP methyl ester carboxylesterase
VSTTTTNDGTELYYQISGDGETVVFVGDAGLGAWQWGWQHGHLAGPYRTLTWDFRGTGESDTPEGPYDIDILVSDLECILSATGTANCHLVGAGLGGMIALRYAREFSRADTLSLFSTAASGDHVERARLEELCPHEDSTEVLRDSLSLGFSERFLTENSDLVDQICAWRREEDARYETFKKQASTMCSFNSGALYEITTPTLVYHGVDNSVIPVAAGETLADDLPRGTFEAVEGKHLCHIEHSRPVTDRLVEFIEDYSKTE